MSSFAASADALQSLSREQHWWLQVGSTEEDRELWGWMRELWPASAEDLSLVDTCILLRPLICNDVSCVDLSSQYFLHAQRSFDGVRVTTQALPSMLDEALAKHAEGLFGDTDSATRAIAVHALVQLQPPALPRSAPPSLALPPHALDYFEFLGELYTPDAVTVLRLYESRLSAAVSGLALNLEVPVFRWEVSRQAHGVAAGGRRGSGSRASPDGFFPVESALRRLRLQGGGDAFHYPSEAPPGSGSVAGDDDSVWDDTDCACDSRLEWRSAVTLFRAIGLVDLLPLSVVRAIAREVTLHSQAHWRVARPLLALRSPLAAPNSLPPPPHRRVALALVERGASLADAVKTVREAQTLVRRGGGGGGRLRWLRQ